MSITARQYSGEADYAGIRRLIDACNTIGGQPYYVTPGILDWWRFSDPDFDAISAVRLWIDDHENVLGFVWPIGAQIDLLAHPHHRALEDDMLNWADGILASAPQNGNAPIEVMVFSYAGDAHRAQTLATRGYARDARFLNYRTRSLELLPDLNVASGYELRGIKVEDLESRVAAHMDAFPGWDMTAEQHRRVMSSPTYRNDLDIVAVAPDSSIAAFCIVWYDDVQLNGVFEPVGCHADHRQLGLASAVMVEAMTRLKALGTETVCVASSETNVAANRLYESLGFSLLDSSERWTKRL